MKKAVSVSALALLLLTGCTAAAEAKPEGSVPPSPAGPAAAPATSAARPSPAQETEEQSCAKLMGDGGSGPLYKSIQLVRISDGTFSFQPSSPENTEKLHKTVLAAADTAPEDIGVLLTALSAGTEKRPAGRRRQRIPAREFRSLRLERCSQPAAHPLRAV